MKRDVLTEKVIGCAIEVYRVLGPGLLESAYEQCLARELSLQGICFQLQLAVPVEYEGVRGTGLLLNFSVELLKDGITRFKL